MELRLRLSQRDGGGGGANGGVGHKGADKQTEKVNERWRQM